MNAKLLSLVVAVVPFLSFAPPAAAILEGYTDGTAHPYVGAVDIRVAGAPIVASGVLVSPTVLVTAGHVARFFLRAGQALAPVTFDPVVTASSTWYWGHVHMDPAFTSPETQDDPNDLGVIVFDDPIPGITPALLPTENFLDQLVGQQHQTVIFQDVGYGVTTHVGGASNQGLHSFTGDGTRKFLHAEFVTAYTGWLQVDPLDGHECYGDSGGPVLLGNVAVAIHKANGNSEFCKGAVFDMRLDNPQHRTFLGQYLTLP
jgi:hypothetical protein